MSKRKSKVEYRILCVPDYDYQIGDAEDADEVRAILNHDGAWGFVVESRKVAGEWHTDWDVVDSCFGFLGTDDDYMMEQALASIPKGYGTVKVYDDAGHEINTVEK